MINKSGEVSAEIASELYDIREVLDGLSARLACTNMPRKKVNDLEDTIEKMEQCILNGNKDELFELYNSWNAIIVSCSKNQSLDTYITGLNDNLSKKNNIANKDRATQEEIILEYREILGAFEDGNADYAERAARQHVRNSKKRYIIDVITP